MNGRIRVGEINTLRISRDIYENKKVRIMSEKRLVTYIWRLGDSLFDNPTKYILCTTTYKLTEN